jgi:transposase
MANGRGRDKRREAFWRRAIHKQRNSGLTVRAFCRGSDLSEPTFYYWRRELERRDSAQCQTAPKPRKRRTQLSTASLPEAVPAFVPVRVTEETASKASGRIEIVLSAGRRVQVIGPVDRAALADVLAVLEGQPC